MIPNRSAPSIRPGILALTALLVVAPFAAAAGAPSVDASHVLFGDATVIEAGIDLAWDDGLVVVLGAPGEGALGDASFVPANDLPTNAVGEIISAEALRRTGLVSNYANGVMFTTTSTSVDAVTAAFAERLAALGFAIDHAPGARDFRFTQDGDSYRAVFGAHADGVTVYLGN